MQVKIFGKEVFSVEKRAALSDLANPKEWLTQTLSQNGTLFSSMFSDYFKSITSGAGINVNEDTALSFTAVYSCIKILSEHLAILPLEIYKELGDNKREIAKTHIAYKLLSQKPSKYFTAYMWKQTMMANLAGWGNAYSLIVRDTGGFVKELNIVHPQNVKPFISEGILFYNVSGLSLPVRYTDMIHLKGLSYDGIIGLSPISAAKESIGEGMAAQKFGAAFFKNGAKPSLALEVPNTLSQTAYNNLEKSFKDKKQGADHAGEVIILEGGMKAVPFSISPDDAQFIQTRKFSVEEISRIYRVPLHMLSSLERSTNNNIEQQAIEFYKNTMTPYCENIEQELHDKLFAEKEKDIYYPAFDLTKSMRGDHAARTAYYTGLFNIGAMSANEIRDAEDMDAVDGGDKHFVQVNTIPMELAGESIKQNIANGNK